MPPPVPFEPIAVALREAIIEHFAARGEDLDDDAGRKTVDTNSSLAAARADMLATAYLARSGHSTLEDLQVADLGCGFGALALALAARGAFVTAMDPNKRRMKLGARLAGEFGLDVRFKQGRLQDPDLETDAFDLVVVNNALCYVVDRADRRAALASVHRVVVPGGWAVLRDPNRAHPRDVFTGLPLVHRVPPRMTNALVGAFGVSRSQVRLTTPRTALAALRRAGFERVRFDGAGGPATSLDRLAGYHHISGRKPER